MAKLFYNITNHPSLKWSEEQKKAAEAYGEIVDWAFPNVPADATPKGIHSYTADIVGSIKQKEEPENITVLIQGESTLVYCVVNAFQQEGIRCVAATSERKVTENPDGTKTVAFEFVQFREYIEF